MSTHQNPGEGRNRRHFVRIAAAFAATVALPIIRRDKAAAAGRHSDPELCDPLCLLRGAQVQTWRGDVAVEALERGDRVQTESGVFKTVKWIGCKVYRRAPGSAWPASVDPVRIMRSAIEPGVPSRDLFISPEHALFLNGNLIPVKHLINGITIAQGVHDSDVIEYFHVECDAHEVIFAEDLAVETLRVTTSYEAFGNFADHARLFGDTHVQMDSYAPVLGYWSARDDAIALLRQAATICVDMRDPIQIAYDRLAERARLLVHSGGLPSPALHA
jgi:hypothetical protein